MKYGCRTDYISTYIDKMLLNANKVDEILQCESSQHIITIKPRKESIDEISYLNAEVEREMKDFDLSLRMQPELIKSLVNELQTEIVSLNEHITFYRNDIQHKNNTIEYFVSKNIEMQAIEDEIKRMDGENKHLHELMIFLTNQVNNNTNKNNNIIDDTNISWFSSESSVDRSSDIHKEDSIKSINVQSTNEQSNENNIEQLNGYIGSTNTRQLEAVRAEKHEEFKKRRFSENEDEDEDDDNYEEIAENIEKSYFEEDSFTVPTLWEKHSKGYPSKILRKMGFGGKGLGKNGDGITHPILVDQMSRGTNQIFEIKRMNNKVFYWPKGTTLITGSSILSGITENRLKRHKAKVRAFPGACVDDMYDYLLPLLKKKPSNVVLYIGSNDAPHKKAYKIAEEILSLKSFIEHMVPDVNVFLSCPVLREDNKRANITLCKLADILKSISYHVSSINVIINENIDKSCLGKGGLHLNQKGSGRLAVNFISLMQRL